MSSSLSGIELRPATKLTQADGETVLSFRDVRFGWKASSSDTSGITLEFQSSATGTLVMLIGSVGCGKSTFLKGLAGETPVLEGQLFIRYPDIAFCDENAWLSNASIRRNIIGEDETEFDPIWYRSVINACALDPDLKRMAKGDDTIVGSKGSKLSGGQRQRIVSCRCLLSFVLGLELNLALFFLRRSLELSMPANALPVSTASLAVWTTRLPGMSLTMSSVQEACYVA